MSPVPAHDLDRTSSRSRVQFEALFASAWIGFGLLVLPALIYWVGGLVLGPYDGDGGLGRFYGDFFADLAEPSGRAWLILLGPLLTVSLLRLIFRSPAVTTAPPREPAPAQGPKARAEAPRRVEPRLGNE